MFKWGVFLLHSKGKTNFLIDCNSLTDEDWDTIAWLIASRIMFGSVEGVPNGGLALAKALRPFVSRGPLLIVDDVMTTGASMEQQRAGRGAIGVVLFARGLWPDWVQPIFVFDCAWRFSYLS